jgi:hypothetical protein
MAAETVLFIDHAKTQAGIERVQGRESASRLLASTSTCAAPV